MRSYPAPHRHKAEPMTDSTISIDAASAVIEKRMIAFGGVVDGDDHKFIMSIADFAHFGVENAKADPIGAVEVISANLATMIGEKIRKDELLPTTKLAAL